MGTRDPRTGCLSGVVIEGPPGRRRKRRPLRRHSVPTETQQIHPDFGEFVRQPGMACWMIDSTCRAAQASSRRRNETPRTWGGVCCGRRTEMGMRRRGHYRSRFDQWFHSFHERGPFHAPLPRELAQHPHPTPPKPRTNSLLFASYFGGVVE